MSSPATIATQTAAKVMFCCWCRMLRVSPGRADDHLTVTIAGKTRIAILNGEPITIADGTCEPCAATIAAKCPQCSHRHAGDVCKQSVPVIGEPTHTAPCGCSHRYQDGVR